MLAMNCSRVRCIVSSIYNTLNTPFCLSNAKHLSFRFLDGTPHSVSSVNVFQMRIFADSSLKQGNVRGSHSPPVHQREQDTAIVDGEPPKDNTVDLPEYDRFGLLAADQDAVHYAELGGKRKRENIRKKSPVASEWSQTFGTLSNDVDEFLDKYTKKR